MKVVGGAGGLRRTIMLANIRYRSTASHSCDYMGYVHYVGHGARSSKNQM